MRSLSDPGSGKMSGISDEEENLSFGPEGQRPSGRQQKGVAPADRQMIFDPSVCDQKDRAALRKIFCVFQKINRRL